MAFITYEYPPETGKGGIGTFTVQMSLLLSNEGFDVHVFCGSHTKDSTTNENGVTVNRIKCSNPETFRENVEEIFASVHADDPFDCIESPEINANAWNIKKKFPDLPLIVRLHAPNFLVESTKKTYLSFWQKSRYFLGGLRRGKWDLGYWKKYDYASDIDYRFASMAEHIVAPTEVMKQWVLPNWKLQAKRVKVVSNPLIIDSTLYAEPIASEPMVLFYGRLNVLKGMVTITRAMKSILKNNAAWKWVVIGDDGPGLNGTDSMKNWMLKQLTPVCSQVTFLDGLPYHKIPSYLQKASIVVIPSLFESFSYVCAESMAAGKAIVGSSGTGMASLISHSESGLLAHPQNPKEWVKHIQALIDNPAFRNSMGANARAAIVKRQKDNDKIVGQYYSMCNAQKQYT